LPPRRRAAAPALRSLFVVEAAVSEPKVDPALAHVALAVHLLHRLAPPALAGAVLAVDDRALLDDAPAEQASTMVGSSRSVENRARLVQVGATRHPLRGFKLTSINCLL
jgi:hypothetical protein